MIFSAIILTTNAACSYKVPNVDDIVFDVPLDADFADTDMDEGGNGRFRKTRNVNNVNSVNNDIFQPLRIHLYYDKISIDKLTTNVQFFVNTSLLPEAVNYWQAALAVRPTAIPIRLYRKCESNLYYMRVYEKRQSCVLGCKKETSCGEVIIPDEHLYQCRYCTSPESQNCGFNGPPDGVGVPNTDFLLYVSAVLSERCKNVDTVAYAAHCQQEADLDRPIAGHVNLCPNALSTALHDREVLLSTVKHEILHALGFSAGLYAFFRDDNGNPRTRRNRYNKPISLNKDRSYYNWDPSTIQTIIRNDWWTAEGMVPHPVHVMVTPRVQQEARQHFNCLDLEGAELENQGGDGTAFTHWEKRLFENEAMTGTHTQNPVYSRLTFALLEDSGWYKANYSAAEELHWGHHLGCEFARKSCGEWIRNRREKNLLLAPFCDEIKHDGKRSLATTRCTTQRDSLALCNLIPYQKPLPLEYRNFAFLDEVQDDSAIYYGGSVELADYCPYNQEFEWKALNSSERRDSRCELDGNFTPNQANSILEVYGNQSKCFDLATFWTERKCGRIRTFLQYKAGCYQYECSEGRLNIGLFNESFFYPCYFTGQYVHIRKIINGWLREGVIICPPCEEICHSGHFSLDDKFGYCQEINKDEIPEYVGDMLLNEPCAASTSHYSFIFFLSIFLIRFLHTYIVPGIFCDFSIVYFCNKSY
ncbi:Leishmanolysin family protein [Acanthocheilonema viteae]